MPRGFTNQVDTIKFRSTNLIWNQLKLNSPWSVGYVSSLIDRETFGDKDEWKAFYFASGEQRLREIESRCNDKDRQALMDFTKNISQLPTELKNLNLYYGRTEDELRERGKFMYQKLVEAGNPYGITLPESVYMVKFRVIGETWNGIMSREQNTVKTLQGLFPSVSFQKVEGARDYQYAIDYELFVNNRLWCAIQIKPVSYKKGSRPEHLKAKRMNAIKNQAYIEEYNADVFYLYSNSRGDIENRDTIVQMKAHLEHQLANAFICHSY